MARAHSDMLFGDGVMAETLKHFHVEAIHKGTAEAWQRAYDETNGIEFLWIVYTGRLRDAGQRDTGIFESMAISNQMRQLMYGCDQFESRPGDAAIHRGECKRAWEQLLKQRAHRSTHDL